MKLKHFAFIALAASFAISCNTADKTGWAPVGDRIMTQWGENLDPSEVLPEYPRPQMVRGEWMNLNGLWEYAITPAEAEPDKMDGNILVPFAVESALSGVGRAVGENEALWYEREFIVPEEWAGQRVQLNFGAVDWKAEVYVDGAFVGEHTGGYAPFSFDVTDMLAKGKKHSLKVKVTDRTDKWFQPRGKQVSQPEGIWYTAVTGIWQTVWMEPVPASHIDSYYAVADIDEGTLAVTVDAALEDGDVVEVVLLADGDPVAKAEGREVTLAVPEMRLWSPSDPYLYDLEIKVLRDGVAADAVKGYTAMRKISYAADKDGHKRMLLNNEPLFQYGPLDQGWWPDGLYTAPTDEALRYDVQKTKDFGFNMIRKHIKVEPARWYMHCDQLGIIVWQDMPSGDKNPEWQMRKYFDGAERLRSPESEANYRKEWKEIMDYLYSYPCIGTWVPFNEAWGQFDTPAVVKFTREVDPTRLINPASGGNFDTSAGIEGLGDILDVHHYPCPAMNIFERKLVNVLGEYGGIGLPVEGHTWIIDRKWGYGGNKKNSEEVMKQYEDFLDMLKVFVQTGCAAAVYTQTTDVEGEVNGLMTYDRAVIKVDMPRIAAGNKSVIESMPAKGK